MFLCPYSFTFSNVYFSVFSRGEEPGLTFKKELNLLHPKCSLKEIGISYHEWIAIKTVHFCYKFILNDHATINMR